MTLTIITFLSTSHELFTQFDSTQMAFNPTIPLPKAGQPKLKRGKHLYIRSDFKQEYGKLLQQGKVSQTKDKQTLQIDFFSALQ